MATPQNVTTTATEAQRQDAMLARRQVTNLDRIKAYAKAADVQERFTALLGSRDGRAYVESVIIAVANSDDLQQCTPKSIMISAMRAASLRLSVDPALHQAHLVPFGGVAQLIVDYHGLVQLTENTGYYAIAPHVAEVYEGETVNTDRFTGRVTITGTPTEPRTVKGWCGYFKSKNGVERWLYMSNEECDAHGQKYSKAFNSKRSGWQTDREKMRRKTVLRNLVNRWGRFSPHVESVLRDEEVIYDGQTGEIFEATAMPSDENIIVPEPEKHTEGELLEQLGFGAQATHGLPD